MKLFRSKKKKSLCLISFLQAVGLTVYCGMVALIFWQGERWFGKITNFWGPVLLLVLLTTSVLVCALIALGYPVYLFWQKKETIKAMKIVGYTTGWLILFVFLLVIFLAIF